MWEGQVATGELPAVAAWQRAPWFKFEVVHACAAALDAESHRPARMPSTSPKHDSPASPPNCQVACLPPCPLQAVA